MDAIDDVGKTTEIMYRLNETQFKNKLEEQKDRMRELVDEICKCETTKELDVNINKFNESLTSLGDQCREESLWHNELDALEKRTGTKKLRRKVETSM